jgi:prepilin-type N-terminal cleavage/methylation domain-containing protein
MGVLSTRAAGSRDEGFSLVEVLVSMGILAVALLSLAGVFTMSLARASNASADIIAKEQASQAIESIFAGRDSGRLQWTDLQNVAQGGIFKDGLQDVVDTGADRISNTTDDGTTIVTIRKPGPDGNLGNSDDLIVSLTNYKRQVLITASTSSADTLRQVKVIIEYTVSGFKRRFEMVSYISSYGS